MTYPTYVGRGRPVARRALLALTTALIGTLAAPALAQTDAPPARFRLDANGIDLATGRHVVAATELSIGSGASSLAVMRGSGYAQSVQVNGSVWSVGVPSAGLARSYTFTQVGSVFTSTTGEGATLVTASPGYVLTLADGTEYTYGETTLANADGTFRKARLTKIKLRGGETLTLVYANVTYCTNNLDGCSGGTYITKVRLQSVTSSYGYQLRYQYQNNQALNPTQGATWDKRLSVRAVNLAVDYCDPAASTCTTSQTWPQVSYSSTFSGQLVTDTVSDSLGTTRYTTDNTPGAMKFKIKRPSSTGDNVVVSYDNNGLATSVAVDGQTWTYAFSLAGALRTATITAPDSTTRVVVSDINVGLPVSVKDELNRTTAYTYDTSGRLTRATSPEGDYVQYAYDARGNVTEQRAVAETPGTPADIVTTAGYDASCANIKTCNQPIWTKDAKGAQTDYTYDSTHGGVLTVTAPAPTGGAIRPQVRYGYSSLQAFYKNASGSIVASGVPVYRLTSTSACQTQTSCTGSTDEVKSVISYGSQASGTANNLLPVSMSSGAGNGSLTATSTATYDIIGNLVAVDGPLAGTEDTTRYVYDAGRQVTMMVSADPDGAGALKNRASKMQYTPDGLVSTQSIGTANADGSGFVAFQVGTSTYDPSNRLVRSEVQNGSGTPFSVTQYSYDTKGRIDCTALRMNTAAYGSLPSSACTTGTAGADGPDRISKVSYTTADEVQKTTSALGLLGQSDDVAYTYNLNGTVNTLTDAKGNVTTYVYDGHNRLSQTRYPTAGNGSVSSTTDYDGLSYDPNGNVTSRRLRDGQVLGYTYDALDRRTLDDNPGGNAAEADVAYVYDNLARLRSATDANGWHNSFEYDALDRTTRQYSNVSSNTFQYDPAGRMTRQTWADTFYVTYDYLTTGEVSTVKENGTLSLASFAYDDLGRRVSLARGNGTTTTYSHDPISRLSGLTHDLTGSAQDLTLGFGYNAGGQITSTTRSNDAYAWGGHYNVNRVSGTNGLNQLSSIGAITPTYDGRGNLTSTGGQSYTYNTRKQLFTNGAGQLFYRNPVGLLNQITANGATTSLDYVGANLASEFDSSGLLRRYVYGLGIDEPLVWYEGAGTSDRRYLHADERGSVVAVSNAAGTATLNTYDEYGQPGTGNTGRFGYTGQKWISELGLYDYKARMYAPSLGRFMQTDPIGYADGMNLYGYVGGDPVNRVDPFGLTETDITVTARRLPKLQNGAALQPGLAANSLGSSAGSGAGAGNEEKPQKEEVRSKPLVCKALGRSGYDVRKAWQIANTARKSKTNGQTNWNNQYLRETENWLTAASDYYAVPFARTPQIYMHQYRKTLPFSGSTPFSQEALDAGLDGQAHNGDTPEQLKAWCNGK